MRAIEGDERRLLERISRDRMHKKGKDEIAKRLRERQRKVARKPKAQ